MRWLACTIVLWAATAMAGPSASELETEGETLAKAGRYTEAIDAFKAADRIAPRAAHKCLIALAYTRRELWPQAEIFMARCHVLATTEPLPEWVPQADALIAERLSHASVAEVEIVVEPAGTPAELSVSSFAPDETFAPATKVHLGPGHHVITARAPGFEPEQHAIDIAGTSPRTIAIRLYRTGTRPRPPSLRHALLVGSAVSLGAGVAAYGVMGIGWLKLRERDANNFGGTYQRMYEIGRPVSLSLFALGAGLAITGLLMHAPAAEHFALAPVPGGAMLAVELTR